jgi:hypothetical protein
MIYTHVIKSGEKCVESLLDVVGWQVFNARRVTGEWH